MVQRKELDHDSPPPLGIAYAKPIAQQCPTKSFKGPSYRDSMSKDLPEAPIVNAAQKKSMAPKADSKAMQVQADSEPYMYAKSKKLLSLVRPDSWNVLSMAELEYHKQGNGAGYKQRISLHAKTSLRRKHSLMQQVANSVMLNESMPSAHKVRLSQEQSSSRNVGLASIPEGVTKDSNSTQQSQDRPNIRITLPEESADHKETQREKAQSQRNLTNPQPLLLSGEDFKLAKVDRHLPKQFQDFLLTCIEQDLQAGMLQGTSTVRNNLSTKIFVHNLGQRKSSKSMSGDTRKSVQMAIVWLIEAHGWPAAIKLTWKGGNYLHKIKYQLTI